MIIIRIYPNIQFEVPLIRYVRSRYGVRVPGEYSTAVPIYGPGEVQVHTYLPTHLVDYLG